MSFMPSGPWGLIKETIGLQVGGQRYTGWKTIQVKASAKSPERTFSITVTDETPALFEAAWSFMPGTRIDVTASGSPVLSGFVTELEIEFSAENHELHLTGKSFGHDLIKNSVDHETNEWNGKDTKEIATDISSRYNVPMSFDAAEAQLRKIDKFRCNVGEKCWPVIDRLLRNEGLFATGMPDGSVKVTKHGKERHAGGLVQGGNIKTGKVSFSDENLHEQTIAKGQKPHGTGKANTQVEATHTNPNARPGTKLILPGKTGLDADAAKKRAEQASRVRNGLSIKADITVPTWRDAGGEIWMPGKLIYVESPILKLKQDLALQELTLEQSANDGTKAEMSLVSPEALGASKGRSKGSSEDKIVW